jgi:hypothetical protein
MIKMEPELEQGWKDKRWLILWFDNFEESTSREGVDELS